MRVGFDTRRKREKQQTRGSRRVRCIGTRPAHGFPTILTARERRDTRTALPTISIPASPFSHGASMTRSNLSFTTTSQVKIIIQTKTKKGIFFFFFFFFALFQANYDGQWGNVGEFFFFPFFLLLLIFTFFLYREREKRKKATPYYNVC